VFVDSSVYFSSSKGTLNHCLGGRTDNGCGERVGFSWGSNPGTAPPVIKDLLDRPWNTLVVIAAWGEGGCAVYVGW
jgi:hypothetical protein